MSVEVTSPSATNQTSAGTPSHRPYRWATADFQLGLRPMRPETWIQIGAEHPDMMRQKWDRLDHHRPFFYRTLPSSVTAQRELRDRVSAHLIADHADSFERRGSVVVSILTGRTLDLNDATAEPLLHLSYMVEEDFMLLEDVA